MNAHRIIIPGLQLAETKTKKNVGGGISSLLKPCKTLFINTSANLTTKCTRVLKPKKKKRREFKACQVSTN
jgi:hypothetical protein